MRGVVRIARACRGMGDSKSICECSFDSEPTCLGAATQRSQDANRGAKRVRFRPGHAVVAECRQHLQYGLPLSP